MSEPIPGQNPIEDNSTNDNSQISNSQEQTDLEAEEWVESLPPHIKEKIGDTDFYRLALGEGIYKDAFYEISGKERPEGDFLAVGTDLFRELLKGTPLKDIIKKDMDYKMTFKHRAGNIMEVYGHIIEDAIQMLYDAHTRDKQVLKVNKERGTTQYVKVPVSEEVKEENFRIKELALQRAKEIESELENQQN